MEEGERVCGRPQGGSILNTGLTQIRGREIVSGPALDYPSLLAGLTLLLGILVNLPDADPSDM